MPDFYCQSRKTWLSVKTQRKRLKCEWDLAFSSKLHWKSVPVSIFWITETIFHKHALPVCKISFSGWWTSFSTCLICACNSAILLIISKRSVPPSFKESLDALLWSNEELFSMVKDLETYETLYAFHIENSTESAFWNLEIPPNNAYVYIYPHLWSLAHFWPSVFSLYAQMRVITMQSQDIGLPEK